MVNRDISDCLQVSSVHSPTNRSRGSTDLHCYSSVDPDAQNCADSSVYTCTDPIAHADPYTYTDSVAHVDTDVGPFEPTGSLSGGKR